MLSGFWQHCSTLLYTINTDPIVPSQQPNLLSYCCYVWQAIPLSLHTMFSRNENYIAEQWVNQQFSSLSPPKLIYSPVLFVYQTKWRIRRYDWSDRLSVKIFVKGQLRVLLLLFDGAIASPYTQACGATVWKVRHVYSCRPGQQHIWFNGIYIWRKLYRPLEYWG